MTYKKYKTGTFRVCVFLTILMEAYVIIKDASSYSIRFFGTRFDLDEAVIGIPVFIWGTYFFSLWIYKGFIDKQ